MDFPYDKNENPITTIQYINDITFAQEFGEPYNLFDYSNGFYRYISFQELHDTNDENKWRDILSSVSCLDGLILIDDIHVNNDEVKDMKNFYLKVYYWNLKQHNENVYVYKTDN